MADPARRFAPARESRGARVPRDVRRRLDRRADGRPVRRRLLRIRQARASGFQLRARQPLPGDRVGGMPLAAATR